MNKFKILFDLGNGLEHIETVEDSRRLKEFALEWLMLAVNHQELLINNNLARICSNGKDIINIEEQLK